MLLLLVVAVAHEERRTFGLTIIIVSFSSFCLSLFLFVIFVSLLLLLLLLLSKRGGKIVGHKREEKFGGKILSQEKIETTSTHEYKNISSLLNFYFADDSVTPLEQLLLDGD